jgi:anti-sigma B factor antagonist
MNFTTLEAQINNYLSMEIIKESEGGIVILALNGRLDTLNHSILENEIASLIEKKQKDIILDCQDLDYVSSSGLRILLKALNQVKTLHGRFSICNLQPQIIKVFKISGFDHLFELFPGRNEAIASYQ